jgi:hypothetical protein
MVQESDHTTQNQRPGSGPTQLFILLGRGKQVGLSVLLKDTEKQNVSQLRFESRTAPKSSSLPLHGTGGGGGRGHK